MAASWNGGTAPEDAVKRIRDTAMAKFGLTYGPRAERRRFLWE